MDNIVLYSLGIVWYIFCTIGFYYLITKEITLLKLNDKLIIFILSLFFSIILCVIGFASIMVKIEEKFKGY